MSKLSIVVPVYYNEDTLMDLYEDMQAKILDRLGDYEIVFVDDGSKDGTAAIAAEHGAIVRTEPRQGKGNVVRSMFRDIDADYYLMVDGDDTSTTAAAASKKGFPKWHITKRVRGWSAATSSRARGWQYFRCAPAKAVSPIWTATGLS